MRSIMVKVNEDTDVSALHITHVNEVEGAKGKWTQVCLTTGPAVVADCSKNEMKRRIDAAWEGR